MIITASVSIAISVMVMVVAVAVVDGFTYEIESKVKGVVADYNIVSYGAGSLQGATFEREEVMENDITALGLSIYPYLTQSGLARKDSILTGVMLKGIANSERLEFYRNSLISGRVPDINQEKRVKEIVISNNLSRKLGVTTGDKLEVVFMEEPPLRERFDVVGVYNSTVGTVDKGLIITDIRNTQYIAEVDNSSIGGYEVLYDGDNSIGYELLCSVVDIKYGDAGLMVRSIRDDYPQIFSWLGLQQSNELVIITIMMVVGIINVVSLLLILLLHNIYQIGVLTVLGMTKKSVRMVFMINSLIILLRAMAIGNVTILALLAIQKKFKILKLDPEGYSVDSVPVHFDWGDIITLNIVLISVLILFQWITTMFISRVKPTVVMKYEKR